MTDLRRRILEELQRRNFSETTIKTYLRVIEDFAQYFGKRPDRGSTKYICCKSGSSQSRRFGCTLPPCDSSTLRHCDVRVPAWKSILESFRTLLKRCGFKRAGVHILQHTFGAHLAQKGVEMSVIRDLLGHHRATHCC